jgi:hypothetical protein
LVVAQWQAAGVVTGQHFGYFFGLVLLPTAFLYSRSLFVAGSIAVAMALVVAAALLDFEWSTRTELYLDSAAWLIAGARAQRRGGARRVRAGADHVSPRCRRSAALVALYDFVALAVPEAFTNLPALYGDVVASGNLIYFSFVTLTTTGYGDIVPLHPYARSLAIFQRPLLARLVTLELPHESGS